MTTNVETNQGADLEADERIECQSSEPFANWLAQLNGSLAVTTYQAGKVALLGWRDRRMSLLMRQFTKPMGLAVWVFGLFRTGTGAAAATEKRILAGIKGRFFMMEWLG